MWHFVLTWIWATLVGWILTVIIMVGGCFVFPLYFSFSRQELGQAGFNDTLLILSIAFATAMLGFAQWKLALQGSVSMWQWMPVILWVWDWLGSLRIGDIHLFLNGWRLLAEVQVAWI